MEVFYDKQHRLMLSKFQEDCDESFECFLSLALG
jgi:hypothetical protein